MPCSECLHCRARAERASLHLERTAPHSTAGAVDHAFYREFGAVYTAARARTAAPVKLLCEVNPDLTASRCKDYLKRARALGFVAAPSREGTPPPVVPAPVAPTPVAGRYVRMDDVDVSTLTDDEILERALRAPVTVRTGFDPSLA